MPNEIKDLHEFLACICRCRLRLSRGANLFPHSSQGKGCSPGVGPHMPFNFWGPGKLFPAVLALVFYHLKIKTKDWLTIDGLMDGVIDGIQQLVLIPNWIKFLLVKGIRWCQLRLSWWANLFLQSSHGKGCLPSGSSCAFTGLTVVWMTASTRKITFIYAFWWQQFLCLWTFLLCSVMELLPTMLALMVDHPEGKKQLLLILIVKKF